MTWNIGRWNPARPARADRPGRGARAFSLIEILVVLAIIGTLAGLVVSLAARAGVKAKRNRVEAELAQLVSAIESYHAKMGFYPPSNTNSPAVSPLYYELVGTRDTGTAYTTLTGDETIPKAALSSFFRIGGFLNASTDPSEVRNFHRTLKSTQFKQISASPDVEVLTAPMPGMPVAGLPPEVNPWRYVSVNPTNNPNSFDLWAEVLIGNKVYVIGNWKD